MLLLLLFSGVVDEAFNDDDLGVEDEDEDDDMYPCSDWTTDIDGIFPVLAKFVSMLSNEGGVLLYGLLICV